MNKDRAREIPFVVPLTIVLVILMAYGLGWINGYDKARELPCPATPPPSIIPSADSAGQSFYLMFK